MALCGTMSVLMLVAHRAGRWAAEVTHVSPRHVCECGHEAAALALAGLWPCWAAGGSVGACHECSLPCQARVEALCSALLV